MTPITLTRSTTSTTTTAKTVTGPRESPKLFTHPVRHVRKQTTPQKNVILEPMQPIDRLPRQRRPERQNPVQERSYQNNSNKTTQTADQHFH